MRLSLLFLSGVLLAQSPQVGDLDRDSQQADLKSAERVGRERLRKLCLDRDLDAALLADGEALLDDTERQALAGQMTAVREQLAGEDIDALRRVTEDLGRASETFATRRMDKSIREALSGVSLDELDKEVEQ